MAHAAGPKAQHLAIRVRATSDVNGSLQGTYLAAVVRDRQQRVEAVALRRIARFPLVTNGEH